MVVVEWVCNIVYQIAWSEQDYNNEKTKNSRWKIIIMLNHNELLLALDLRQDSKAVNQHSCSDDEKN